MRKRVRGDMLPTLFELVDVRLELGGDVVLATTLEDEVAVDKAPFGGK